jgi:lipopolysaccharide transport system permease protein
MTLSQYFRLVHIQAKLALKGDASRYYLGYIWWVLEPMLFVAVFYFVFDVILDSGRADFLVFLICGKIPFIWFSKSVNSSANAIIGNAGLIGKIDVPKTMFPLVRIHEGAYREITVFAFLLVFLLAMGYSPGWNWLWIVPIALLEYLIIVTCGFIASTIVCYVRDFSLLVSLGTLFLMFSSGLFWDPRSLPDPRMGELILTYNPIAFLLDAYRQALMFNTAPDLELMVGNVIVFGAALVLTVGFMRSRSQSLALRALTA